MIFRQYSPSLQLSPYITKYELRHFVLNPSKSASFKPFPPSPYHYLNFIPVGHEEEHDPVNGLTVKKPTAMLTGLYTHRVDRYISSEFLMVTAIFKPGALHCLTHMPFEAFSNSSLDMECAYPKAFKEVNEQLKNAISYADMINVVDTFLINFINKYCRTDKQQLLHVTDIILKQPTANSIEKLASIACLSLRQFERKFIDYTGLNPKTFLRIARFHESYSLKQAHPEYDWLRIAMACNYTDYQHLAKDYYSFAQSTPPQLFKDELNAPGRLLGLRK